MIAALAETGNVCSAAEAVGIHRRRHYDWCAADPEYRHAAAVALDKAADVLEREAIRRAHEGVRRYKFTSSGQPVMWTNPATSEPEHYYEDSRSDLLLIFMLKAARPEKFRERHDVSGDAIRPIVVTYGPNMQGAIDRI